VENPEEAVDPDIHTRGLEQRVVVGIDLDPAFLQQSGDRSICKDHEGAILRPAGLC
jgi:hypothetical protein